ncbi:MAG: hypothetical protein AVDCRST_MAG68-4672 [uncultured Gemmatimonadetes bacterium]|uniref:CMP/dCMP-type deaminase domain-containing protein n=1 Tax=uncultured Gemmatimonadota bacterium TaxID=203437 RepID=A0A6J4MMR5_9BACT|nr:MAG: hypothetical protein AVDCRST_MAG68-4672 [uncultured Gemmatimonadota bacterium]
MEPKNPRLQHYWNRTVKELTDRPPLSLEEGEAERHRIYAWLVMALVHHYWNGNKNGRRGEYPFNTPPGANAGAFHDADYLGHNIAAIAVDAEGYVVDFEFNHNKLYNSSAEHAEARLIRRVYDLAQVNDSWALNRKVRAREDYEMFEDTTVYTSLESCSQCTGVMALARVWRVVYLQPDHGMYLIGNIVRNLTEGTRLEAPIPIPGDQIGLRQYAELDAAFDLFGEQLKTTPFYIPTDPNEKKSTSHSVTSFLCTRAARDLYGAGRAALEALTPETLAHPGFKPADRDGKRVENALTNLQVLGEVNGFLAYAIEAGRRGTPHH